MSLVNALLRKMRSFLQWVESYFWGIELKKIHSPYSGKLSLWLLNGRLVLNTEHTNYAFDSLHRLFQKVFRRMQPKLKGHEPILILGMGVGSVVQILREERKLPNPITAVEVDEVVLDLAVTYFEVNRFPKLSIHQADAYDWVQKKQIFDYALVVVDVFQDLNVPKKLLEGTFLQHLAKITAKEGRVVFNTISTKENKSLLQNFENQLSKYFSKVELWEVAGNRVWILQNPIFPLP